MPAATSARRSNQAVRDIKAGKGKRVTVPIPAAAGARRRDSSEAA